MHIPNTCQFFFFFGAFHGVFIFTSIFSGLFLKESYCIIHIYVHAYIPVKLYIGNIVTLNLIVQRFATPPVPGIPPPHAMYKVDPGIGSLANGQSGPHPHFDFHPVSIILLINSSHIVIFAFFF